MNLISQLQQKLVSVLSHERQPIMVAYSGGVDSHVLLHCLYTLQMQGKINNPLSAIHIHHGLSPNADHWLQHCQQICQTMDIPLQAAKVNLAQQNRQSLEAVARTARYSKITELAPKQALVLLAQHQDDQLETMLLQLKRGAGPKGMAAMAELTTYIAGIDNHKELAFLRPLLCTSQREIMVYAQELQLQWIEDESNHNVDFERNFLRHKVLPVLTQKWPELAKTASRSAQLCAEQQLLLEEVSMQKLAQFRAADNSLFVDPLLTLSSAWLHQLIRSWLTEQVISLPSQSVLQKLKAELLGAKVDASPILQWSQWQFRRFDGRLFVISVEPSIPSHTLLWQGQKQLSLPAPLGVLRTQTPAQPDEQTQNILLAPHLGEIKLHFGGYAQRFKPLDSACSKPLKQWYKEWKIPPWQRDKIILLTQNEHSLALLLDGKWLLSQYYGAQQASWQPAKMVCLQYQAKQ